MKDIFGRKMITAGIDIGSISTECVILKDEELLGYSIFPTGAKSSRVGEDVLEETLKKVGLTITDLNYIAATGYGRVSTRIAQKIVTEITCYGRGIHWLIPSARTIIDIGGQDCKAIRIDGKGRITNFVMNDKCAAGTGRFLEVMAQALELTLDKMSNLNLDGVKPSDITPTCIVFAESEVISLLAKGTPVEEIVAGINVAVANRIRGMLAKIGVEEDVVLCGGVAKNGGVKKAIAEKLGKEVIVPEEPQIIGALGAALIARET